MRFCLDWDAASPFAGATQHDSFLSGTNRTHLDHARFYMVDTQGLPSCNAAFMVRTCQTVQSSNFHARVVQRIYLLLSSNNRIADSISDDCHSIAGTDSHTKSKKLRTSELCLQIPMKTCKLDLSRSLTVK
ncbi:hypothetical protein VTN96DRAFT_5897 [Rasamsonia emersonii]